MSSNPISTSTIQRTSYIIPLLRLYSVPPILIPSPYPKAPVRERLCGDETPRPRRTISCTFCGSFKIGEVIGRGDLDLAVACVSPRRALVCVPDIRGLYYWFVPIPHGIHVSDFVVS